MRCPGTRSLRRTLAASQTQHTSDLGGQAWDEGPLLIEDGAATVFYQVCCLTPKPVDQPQIATVKLIAQAPGEVTVAFAPDLWFFGLTTAPAAQFTVLEEDGSLPDPLAPAAAAAMAAAGAGSTDAYAVWPASARLGDSVAVLLDVQAAVALAPEKAPLALQPGSFAIELTHLPDTGDPGIEAIGPRTAVELPAAAGSVIVGERGGRWIALALLFDLPAAWTASLLEPGDDVTVAVLYENQLVFDQQTLRIVGSGGQPLPAEGLEKIAELEQRPMLRMRPAWDGSIGFDPSWNVGAVELVLRFSPRGSRDAANLEPVANGDAAGAVTGIELLTETATEKRWKVSLVSPEPFSVEDQGCAGTGCLAGRWSLLDLRLEKRANGEPGAIFLASDFQIEDLAVLDPDGVLLNTSAGTYFEIHAVDDLADAAPGSATPVKLWPRQLYPGDTVAVLFNSEADVEQDRDDAHLDATPDDVLVQVSGPGSFSAALTPTAVVELPAALGSEKVGTPQASQTGKVAFFSSGSAWAPGTYDVSVEHDGAATSGSGSFEVLDPGGVTPVATDLASFARLEGLELGPLIRLRPVWDATTGKGFDPAWTIGEVELALCYTRASPPLGLVHGLSASGNGEAVAGLAIAPMTAAGSCDEAWDVTLVAPAGLTLPLHPGTSSGAVPVGRWSLLDFAVEGDAKAGSTVIFDAAELSVGEVAVFGTDGARLDAAGPGDPFFEITALPEPGGAAGLLAGALGIRALRRWSARPPQGATTRAKRLRPAGRWPGKRLPHPGFLPLDYAGCPAADRYRREWHRDPSDPTPPSPPCSRSSPQPPCCWPAAAPARTSTAPTSPSWPGSSCATT